MLTNAGRYKTLVFLLEEILFRR